MVQLLSEALGGDARKRTGRAAGRNGFGCNRPGGRFSTAAAGLGQPSWAACAAGTLAVYRTVLRSVA